MWTYAVYFMAGLFIGDAFALWRMRRGLAADVETARRVVEAGRELKAEQEKRESR